MKRDPKKSSKSGTFDVALKKEPQSNNPFIEACKNSKKNEKDRRNRSNSESLSHLKGVNPFKSELFIPTKEPAKPFAENEISARSRKKNFEIINKSINNYNNNTKRRNNSPKLKYLRKDLAKIGITRHFVDYLLNNGIKIIDDLLKPHMEEVIAKADEQDRPTLRRLASLTTINTIFPSLQVSTLAHSAGINSIAETARMSTGEFEDRLNNKLSREEMATLYQRFRASEMILANEAVNARTNSLYSITTDKPDDEDGKLYPSASSFKSVVRSEESFSACECPNCMLAVGPIAYLADLVDFALRGLRRRQINGSNNYEKLSVSSLSNILKQPLSDLPAVCSQADTIESYIRLATEVLLRYFSLDLDSLSSTGNEDLKKAENHYKLDTYIELLSRLGTSYEEIRQARSLDRSKIDDIDKLNRLADRIGIDLYTPRNDGSSVSGTLESAAPVVEDTIQTLFQTPDQVTSNKFRQWLENIFGLADVNVLLRNPFIHRPVVAYGEGSDRLRNWNLKGINYGWNTDPYGRIYVSINFRESYLVLTLYSDQNLQKAVAYGKLENLTSNENEITIQLIPIEDSNLNGSVYLSYHQDITSEKIVLEVIPKILSWRLQHLRNVWTKQDWPNDQLAENRPIVDPDIIGPDDFRTSRLKSNLITEQAFDVWFRRREWVNERMKELARQELRHTEGIPDLGKILMHMYEQPVSYGAISFPQVWAKTTPITDFELLSINLSRGEDVEATKNRIINDLYLSVEGFTRLMAIYSKDKLAKADSRNEKVGTNEWQELYSILTQAQKEKFYGVWKDEEKTLKIVLDPEQFWISLSEPKDGDWPSISSLAHSLPLTEQKIPLIDPTLVNLDDLPDYPVVRRAAEIWHDRRRILEQIRRDLKGKHEMSQLGVTDLLKQAIGDPNPGDPLSANLDIEVLYNNTKDGIDLDNTQRTILNDLHMATVDDFIRLMAIKAKDENLDLAKKPTSSEWEDIYTILTHAQKVKREYPKWIAEEDNLANGHFMYYTLKAKLPIWRASREARQDWQQKLILNSRQPIIDIDIIDEYDFRFPNYVDKAFKLWTDRHKAKKRYIEDLSNSLEDSIRNRVDNNSDVLDRFIAEKLGLATKEDLQYLSRQRSDGKNIISILQQIGLDLNWFDRLVSLKRVTPLIQNEKTEIVEILWQSHKRVHLFGAWLREEYDTGIVLGPDYFQDRNNNNNNNKRNNKTTNQAFKDRPTNLVIPISMRIDWEDRLSDRLRQDIQIKSALSDVLKSVDAQAMRTLRDALVLFQDNIVSDTIIRAVTSDVGRGRTSAFSCTSTSSTSIEKKNLITMAKCLSAKLGIDFSTGPSVSSTRIALAIEALQSLLIGVRNRKFGVESSGSGGWGWTALGQPLQITGNPVAVSWAGQNIHRSCSP